VTSINYSAFWNELSKIAFEMPEGARHLMAEAEREHERETQQPMAGRPDARTIKPGMIGKLLHYGIPAAGAVGVGYGTARLVGRPLERWLMAKGVGPRAATFLRYAVPIGTGLGAGYTLAGNKFMDELARKVSGDNVQRQNPPQ
jgi:hypothetical protein